MAGDQENIAALAVLFIMLLIVSAIFQILFMGSDSQDTFLVWVTSRPNLFLAILIVLLVLGTVLSFSQSQR